jgi:hypothetical protein
VNEKIKEIASGRFSGSNNDSALAAVIPELDAVSTPRLWCVGSDYDVEAARNPGGQVRVAQR